MGLFLKASGEMLEEWFQPAALEAALGEGRLKPKLVLQLGQGRGDGLGRWIDQLQRRQGDPGDAARDRIGKGRRIGGDGGEGLQPVARLGELLSQQQTTSDL